MTNTDYRYLAVWSGMSCDAFDFSLCGLFKLQLFDMQQLNSQGVFLQSMANFSCLIK